VTRLADAAIFASIVIGFPLSIWVAYWIPGYIKRRHVAGSNALMERCRIEYLLAVAALERGQRAAAATRLDLIRVLEAQWRRRHAPLRRGLLAAGALAVSAAAYLAIRQAALLLPLWLEGASWAVLLQRGAASALSPSAAALGFGGAVWGLYAWLASWTDPAIVDDCGDRLHRDLSSLREVAAPPGGKRGRSNYVANLTDHEIFGLGVGFSRGELDRARRSLAAQFHPDVAVADREAAEETMKQINAAYDRLRSTCEA